MVAPIKVSSPLHRGQEGVLLRLVEAVDLVEEENRAPVVGTQTVARLGDDAPDVGDRGRDSRELLEVGARDRCDDACERRLAAPRRARRGRRTSRGPLRSRAQARSRPTTCCCPTKSSSFAGRSRRASGARSRNCSSAASAKRSVTPSMLHAWSRSRCVRRRRSSSAACFASTRSTARERDEGRRAPAQLPRVLRRQCG